jgi:hypothetical protein
MARILHPPPERFEPVTARWLVPGGPLHDPERDAVDPSHNEPVTLVGAPPRELAEAAAPDDPAQIARTRRRRRLVALAFVLVALAAVIIGGSVIGF